MLPRVALEYAHVTSCVASTMAWATSRSKPGRLTFSRARRKYTSPELHRSISASTAASGGSVTFILLATSPIALMKQADQPAANNCSGFVPVPGVSGSRELHIQAAIITVGDAATPTARSMGLGGVPHGDPFLG